MKENWETIINHALGSEGGYVNDPVDPGGETNWGISKRAYPKVNIKTLTKQQAIDIYKKDYWNIIKGDELPSGVDLVVFDAAINSGNKQSVKWLQRSVGVTDDGVMGPTTLTAVKKADHQDVVNKTTQQRLQFMKSLDTWYRYGRGWTNRIVGLQVTAKGMIK